MNTLKDNLKLSMFFQVSNLVKEFDKEHKKNITVDKPIFLTVDNWNELKDQFIEERKSSYKTGFNTDEIAVFEVDILKELSIILDNSTIYTGSEKRPLKALIQRYSNELKAFDNVMKTNIKEVKQKTDYSFKNLFNSDELYEKAVKILIENNFITQESNKLKWIYPKTKGFTTKQSIIALCVVLNTKHYFKHNPKTFYYYIEYEFGIKIDKGNYSKASSGFIIDYDNKRTTNYSYTSLFTNIL